MNKIFKYFMASPLPNLLALASVAGAMLLVRASLWLHGIEAHLPAFFIWPMVIGGLGLALFSAADGISRHREYQRIKAALLRRGYNERLFRVFARSRCQRDAALLAASETGTHSRAWKYYRSLGYRWYHLMPDKVMLNPLNFLDPDFIRQAFLPGKKPT